MKNNFFFYTSTTISGEVILATALLLKTCLVELNQTREPSTDNSEASDVMTEVKMTGRMQCKRKN